MKKNRAEEQKAEVGRAGGRKVKERENRIESREKSYGIWSNHAL